MTTQAITQAITQAQAQAQEKKASLRPPFDLKMEVVAFYEYERDDSKKFLSGSCHVYLIDLNIDLRGLRVVKNKDRWRIKIPYYITHDKETKQKVMYPIFTFADKNQHQTLCRTAKKLIRGYVLKDVFGIESPPDKIYKNKNFTRPTFQKPKDKWHKKSGFHQKNKFPPNGGKKDWQKKPNYTKFVNVSS